MQSCFSNTDGIEYSSMWRWQECKQIDRQTHWNSLRDRQNINITATPTTVSGSEKIKAATGVLSWMVRLTVTLNSFWLKDGALLYNTVIVAVAVLLPSRGGMPRSFTVNVHCFKQQQFIQS